MNTWLFALVTIMIIGMPFALAIGVRRWKPTKWLYFIGGVLTFLGALVIHLLLNELMGRIGILPTGDLSGSDLIQAALLLGLSAAVSEELARVIGYRILTKARSIGDGLMMGLGHGGIEAIIVAVLFAAGISALSNFDRTNLLPTGSSAEEYSTLELQLDQIEQSSLIALAPLAERAIALGAQVTFSVLILAAFRTRRWIYVLIAITYHTVVDAAAIISAAELDNPWLVELVLFLVVLPGLIWLFRQLTKDHTKNPTRTVQWQVNLAVFWASLRKELQFQWRTRRILIVLAVFLVFGMLSPIIAKFTPQLISSLEEAAAFAELIPEPSVIDAINQYMSNLTQFGFILVILLGMTAVAGEKEKGTAAMVLSKPVPRWIFVTAKFVAQGMAYLLAITLAGLAAYYYTDFIFDGLSFSGFMLANLLLYLWLMVFSAVTLMGSSIGRSTAVAAGISLAGGILLIILGALPRYGQLFPSGLVGWATAASLNLEGVANGGAAALALGLILLFLTASVSALEEQEI